MPQEQSPSGEFFDRTSTREALAGRIASLSLRANKTRLAAGLFSVVVIGDAIDAMFHSAGSSEIGDAIVGGVALAIAVERGIKSIQLGQRVAAREMVQLLRDEPTTLPQEGNDSVMTPGAE